MFAPRKLLCATAILILGAAAFDATAFTISGTVQTIEGVAIPGARVWLSRSRVVHTAQTDAQGRFSFPNIESGATQLIAYADGFTLGGVEGYCIRDDDTTIVLAPPHQTRVRVINRRYEPIEGARVSRLRVNDQFEVFPDDLAGSGFPVNYSSEDGFLDLPPLPRDGFVSITISRSGYADGQIPALPVGINNFDFPLPDGVKVVGRITDIRGAAVARARVSIYQPRDDGAVALHAGETLTGPDGFYSMLVPPGAYLAAARHPEFAMPEPVKVEPRELAGDAVANLVMPDPHRIDGRALDVHGSPVPLARFAYHVRGYVVDEAVSDARGRFTLIAPEGQGVIHVTAPPRMTTTLFPRVYLAINATDPVVQPPAIEFRPLPDITGRVLAADGSPVSRALIQSLTMEKPHFYVTDEDGQFILSLDAMPEETLRFRVDHPLRFQRIEFEIDPVKLEAPPIRLKEYQPDLANVNAQGVNDLRALVGRPAPEFACTTWFNLPDSTQSLSILDLRGNVVVLTLWAGFDFLGPTRHRANELNAIHSLYADVPDVAFVGIHDSTVPAEQVQRYIRELGFTFPVGCDQPPYETYARYKTQQIPQIVLIDKRGLVRFYATEGRLVELIKVLRRE